MNGLPIAAWRFGGLSGVDAAAPSGPVTALTGGIGLVTGEEAIRQSIMILLSTIPGERVMRPEYGCPLHRVVLSPNDATTAGLAIHYVRQALTLFEPRIDIVHLDAGKPDPGMNFEEEKSSPIDADAALTIWLSYRVRDTGRTGVLSLTLDLSPGRV
jgi:uncharacterized protein